MDARLFTMRRDRNSWDVIAASLHVSRNAAIERGRSIGARMLRAELAPPERNEDQRTPEPLPAGHPISWGALTRETLLDGVAFG